MKKTLLAIFTFISFLPVWVFAYLVASYLTKELLGKNPTTLSVSGTGSMYPTSPKGTSKTDLELSEETVANPAMFPYPDGLLISQKRYFDRKLRHGDIVQFRNEQTDLLSEKLYHKSSGWIKRVIGLPGDTIEIKSGLVYLNNNPLLEPYIASSRSTFGQSFLEECKKVTVPQDSVFVMGDNRKGSGDSREIGFIPKKDLHYVLPIEKQKGILDAFWRNTQNDLADSSKLKINKQEYLDLLNQKRKEAKLGLLKYQPKLESSSQKRGEVIIKYDDFSFEATKSAYPMKKAMADSGYSNIVYGESPIVGYFEANELIENLFEFPDTKEFFLEKDYQEIGLSEVEGILNGCPTQVIVQHLAGYVPPVYSKADIQSWADSVANLNSVIPSWEEARSWDNLNQQDLKRLLDILYQERSIANNILGKMRARKWLTAAEENSISVFNSLSNQSRSLADKLNGK